MGHGAVLVHHCFDWSMGEVVDVSMGKNGVVSGAVNPNGFCRCSKRIGTKERDTLLLDRKACVLVLPGTKDDGTKEVDWNQISERVQKNIPSYDETTPKEIRRAYVNGNSEAARDIELRGILRQLYLTNSEEISAKKKKLSKEVLDKVAALGVTVTKEHGLGAEVRNTNALTPPTKIAPFKRGEGSTLYIRVDTHPEFTKERPGCGAVHIPEYLTCTKCGQKTPEGKDLDLHKKDFPDGTERVKCPFCGAKDGFVLRFIQPRHSAGRGGCHAKA